MGKRNVQQDWEARLAAEGLGAHIGYEAERHGVHGRRAYSLDKYSETAERSAALAVWDCYGGEPGEEAGHDHQSGPRLPAEIEAIASKRAAGEALSDAERKRLQRYRDGSYTGHIGRPRK